jgi:exonuclease VII small subunit
MTKHEAEETPSFEQAYRQLEKIVRELDSGELSLDDLDRKFEEGWPWRLFVPSAGTGRTEVNR